MQSATWTPAALSSERRRRSGICWRTVEAQHRVSTMKLVDTLDEQHALELLVDTTKPPLPPECRHLHYLLVTPFRYGAPYPSGSRFRRAGLTPGVFYASRTSSTAIAEMTFHRLLFFADSPQTPWPIDAGDLTAFSVRFQTSAGIDLTAPPFDADHVHWTHPADYAPCQALADRAREADVEVLLYRSVRDPGGVNVALLACRAFAGSEPLERQTWRLSLNAHGARAICEFPELRLEFTRQAFAADPRVASLRWER
ncbi:MAG: RES family NAD+ phosphorylase [Vicinamibacterales bacterium]